MWNYAQVWCCQASGQSPIFCSRNLLLFMKSRPSSKKHSRFLVTTFPFILIHLVYSIGCLECMKYETATRKCRGNILCILTQFKLMIIPELQGGIKKIVSLRLFRSWLSILWIAVLANPLTFMMEYIIFNPNMMVVPLFGGASSGVLRPS